MQNLSDEDIDKLFRQAAEQQQPRFDPADWEDMSGKLDRYNKRPWLNYYTWTAGVVVVGVVIWLGWPIEKTTPAPVAKVTMSIPQTEVKITEKGAEEKSKINSPDGSTTSFSVVKEAGHTFNSSDAKESNIASLSLKDKTDKTKNVGGTEDRLKLPEENSSSSIHSITRRSSISSMLSAKEKGISKNVDTHNADDVENNNISEERISSDKTSTINQIRVSEKPYSESLTTISKEEVTTDHSQKFTESNMASTPAQGKKEGLHTVPASADSVKEIIVLQEEDKIDGTTDSNQKDSVSKKNNFSRFTLKAIVAPDFSSDRFKTIDKTGLNYGLMVEYFLHKNISVSTGAIWSRKFYSAKDVTYSGYHADRVFGDCRMWDIPVNVNYYFNPSKKYSFFASAGLSSYLMNKENYDYEVDTPYGTNTYSRQITKENNEWFKTLNVSIGLQKQINKRFAVQVEPFLKVPLAGVGYGQISLASFGSFFSLRYTFLSPQK